MNSNAVLLFPPNWSACTSGPHLALPLLSGAARLCTGWHVETWDLSSEFYHACSKTPSGDAVAAAASRNDYRQMDQLYFAWEDAIRGKSQDRDTFGLLSGFGYGAFGGAAIADAKAMLVERGSVYSSFVATRVLPHLAAAEPSVVGVTIASANQVMPAVELLMGIREAVPDALIVLGGNVVTRLRKTSAFQTLAALADQVVVFQGELAFARILDTIDKAGIAEARNAIPTVAGDELMSCDLWPVPSFTGIDLRDGIGPTVLPYVSTRGCYWAKCRFCAIPAGWSSTGYGGSASAAQVVAQMRQIVMETGVSRLKFVDESLSPAKALQLCEEICGNRLDVEWEAYARLETAWEDAFFLERARSAGLRKLYFGLEQAPSASRRLLGKDDAGDPNRILYACTLAGIKAHVFCMVGFPGTSREDAALTTRFLLDNQSRIDTADLVGFRLDRGTSVPGVRPRPETASDCALAIPYEPAEEGVLSEGEVADLERACQEEIWDAVPRLLHPLYRLVGPWDNTRVFGESDVEGRRRMCVCSTNS